MGNEKLKSITVEDVAYADRPTNKFFMNSNPGKKTPEEIAAAAAVRNVQHKTGFEIENEIRENYNSNILNLDPRYAEMEPVNSIIVRYMIHVEQKLKSNLIIPNLATTAVPHKSGMVKEGATDPYRFKQVAVIVAVPSYEEHFKPGMLVQCVSPELIGHSGEVKGYSVEYLHPDYPGKEGPKNPDSPDFGYAIIPPNWIKVIIPNKKSDAQAETLPPTTEG